MDKNGEAELSLLIGFGLGRAYLMIADNFVLGQGAQEVQGHSSTALSLWLQVGFTA